MSLHHDHNSLSSLIFNQSPATSHTDDIKNVQEDEQIKLAIIAANNHYAGFGPGTANIFRNMLGLSEAKWQDREEGQEQWQEQDQQQYDLKQSTLSDFMS
jgi:hypothetical protein